MLRIKSLDHIALHVRDVAASIHWYQSVLGLEMVSYPDIWGEYPVLLLAENGSGLALFPADEEVVNAAIQGLRHLAWRVDRASFDQARQLFNQKEIAYTYEDHLLFHSIYLTDPDGYKVELTTPQPIYAEGKSPHF